MMCMVMVMVVVVIVHHDGIVMLVVMFHGPFDHLIACSHFIVT